MNGVAVAEGTPAVTAAAGSAAEKALVDAVGTAQQASNPLANQQQQQQQGRRKKQRRHQSPWQPAEAAAK
jgi:hypothetical protein